MKDLLKQRKHLKKRKPDFSKQDSHKKGRLSDSWRKPRGTDSKMRLAKKGYRKMVTTGYKSPLAVRGLSASGLKPVLVYNLSDMKKIDTKTECAIIASSVGTKNKVAMLQEALKLNISVDNFKDPQKKLDSIKQEMDQKKAAKAKSKATKEEKTKEKEAAAKKKEAEDKKEESGASKSDTKDESKKSLDEIADEEDKKKQEKKEKDKLLIKKQ